LIYHKKILIIISKLTVIH